MGELVLPLKIGSAGVAYAMAATPTELVVTLPGLPPLRQAWNEIPKTPPRPDIAGAQTNDVMLDDVSAESASASPGVTWRWSGCLAVRYEDSLRGSQVLLRLYVHYTFSNTDQLREYSGGSYGGSRLV